MYRIVSGRMVLAIFLIFIVLVLVIGSIFLSDNSGFNFKSDADKKEFFDYLSLNISKNEPVRQNVIIPQEFDELYSEYNELQKRAGYDLKDYAGKEVVKYTYEISMSGGEDTFVLNVLTYKDRVVGGDISSTSMNGVTLPLKKGIIIGE